MVNVKEINGNFFICIIRDGLDWGILVFGWLVGFDGKVFYLWWDVLFGYIFIMVSGMEGESWRVWWWFLIFIVMKSYDDNDSFFYKFGDNIFKLDVGVWLF